MAFPIRVVFACIVTGLLVWGILDCITNFEENGCEMTWMFEYPKYINVPVADTDSKNYPTYKLYVYGEGDYYTRELSNLRFTGIPVLFIPGNAGSYKQVRSLGSVSLRMAEKPGIKFHFNYFVVDFNEEFSALYGGVLQKQTEFVHVCVKRILRLYKSSQTHPSSVILVGHSMGGMIARALFTLPYFDANSVHTIITQASPHQAPVITIDQQMDMFYQRVNDYWLEYGNTTLAHVTVVSTGGGYRDFQVRSGLTAMTRLLPEERQISSTTMSVPLAWVSTDHLCSVWCRQMVLTTVNALFDIVDKKTLQPAIDVGFRAKIFRHHFLYHDGTETQEQKDKYIKLDTMIPWELHTKRTWRFSADRVPSSKYIAVPVVSMEGEHATDSITIISNITAADWVCTCQILRDQDRCLDCISLTSGVRPLPPRYSNRQFIRMNANEFGDNTHIVIFLPGGAQQVEIIVDKYRMDNRHLVYSLPSLYDSLISFPVSVTDGAAMLQIHNGSVFYSLHLSGLTSVLTSYTAIVTPLGCQSNKKPGLYEGSIMTLSVPWSHENTYSFFRYGEKGLLPVKLQTPYPRENQEGFENSVAHLELHLHPGCHYQLRLHASPGGSLGQFIRFYAVLLPVCFVVILLLALGGQLTAFATGGQCVWFADAVFLYAKPYYIIPVAIILHTITKMKTVSKLLQDLGIPMDDIDDLESKDLWLQFLPILLYLSAFMITILHCYMAHFVLTAISQILGFLFTWLPEKVIQTGCLLQLIMSVVAFVSSVGLCGTVGISISYLLLLSKAMHCYCLHVKYGGKSELSKFNFYVIIALIYMWLIILNAPVILVWAKGLSHSMHLSMDPSRWTSCIATLSSIVLLYTESSEQEKKYAVGMRWTIYLIAVVTIPYSLVRLYRINITISLVLCFLSLARLPALFNRITRKPDKKDE